MVRETVSSIFGWLLDYCNSILYGTTGHNVDRLQHVQNTLARVVYKSNRRARACWTSSEEAALAACASMP